MTIKRYGGRYWAVYDASGTLVCVCLYTKVRKRWSGVWPARSQHIPENTATG